MLVKNILIEDNKGKIRVEISDANMTIKSKELKISMFIDRILEDVLTDDDFRKYKIKLLKKVSKHNIIKKSVSFEYKWNNNWTFSSNIEQIKYSINKYFKLYLERSF